MDNRRVTLNFEQALMPQGIYSVLLNGQLLCSSMAMMVLYLYYLVCTPAYECPLLLYCPLLSRVCSGIICD